MEAFIAGLIVGALAVGAAWRRAVRRHFMYFRRRAKPQILDAFRRKPTGV